MLIFVGFKKGIKTIIFSLLSQLREREGLLLTWYWFTDFGYKNLKFDIIFTHFGCNIFQINIISNWGQRIFLK